MTKLEGNRTSPILKEALFSVPRPGTLNLYKGALPDYHGMSAAFWETRTGVISVGCTVKFVDAKLHTSPVFQEQAVCRVEFPTIGGPPNASGRIGGGSPRAPSSKGFW